MNTFLKKVSVASILIFGYIQGFSQYDTTRIYKAMAKARRGEPITIVVLGGSITQGSLASTDSKRWVNIMTAWWQSKFPTSNITLVNSGIGGTGSDIGVHRLKRDVFSKDPDFVTVEFSVNDDDIAFSTQTMEGLIRQLVSNDSTPGVMMLQLKQENGTTSKERHKPVAIKYGIPMVCFADSIGARLAKDGHTLAETYGDNGTTHNLGNGVHPNDLGMSYIANFMTEELDRIYATLPADIDIKTPNKTLPIPIVSTDFDHTHMYSSTDLAPKEYNGWSISGTSWVSSTVGSEAIFEVDGNIISLLFSKHNTLNRGRVEAWIDNGTHRTLDAFWTETWGPGTKLAIIAQGLTDGKHLLHVKVIENTTQPYPTSHFFEIKNVLKAGNISIIAPIAKAKSVPSIMLNGGTVALDGSLSNDPQGKKLTAFKWTIISAPKTSTAVIPNDADTNTTFKPAVDGNYELGLKVFNGSDTSSFARLSFEVRTTNGTPIANAGNDTTVATIFKIKVNGSKSSDPENDPLTYLWSIYSQPTGSNVYFDNAALSTPSFTPIKPGEYILILTVKDPLLATSTTDTVKITAITGYVGTDVLSDDNNVVVSPNPIINDCDISFTLEKKSFVNISLYSVNGVKLAILLSEEKEQGDNKISAKIKSIVPSGIYFIQIQTLYSTAIKKIVVE